MISQILIDKNSKIYIVCPANNKTGGTELLHQLAGELLNNNKNAVIAYYLEGDCDKENPTPEAFKKYIENNYCFINEIEDQEENILILPEVCIGKHRAFNKIQKCVWWLSVDNYLVNLGKLNRLKKYGVLSFAKHLVLNDYASDNDLKQIDVHMYQSYFAADFLKKKGIKENSLYYLSDYINDIYMNGYNTGERKNNVLYNPKKGYEFTSKLIKKAKGINFVPIINMTNDEVRDLMNKSKVYIDFGNHPGKDRIPREAAMCGCCILTNRKGSAGYQEDVPIPDDCKFIDNEENIDDIILKIEYILNNFEESLSNYASYRDFISKEKNEFKQCVLELFG